MLEYNNMQVRGFCEISSFKDVESIEHLDAIRDGLCPDMKPFHVDAKSNVITLLGRKRVAELLGGNSTAFVTEMAIGDGGASAIDPSIPLIPKVADTALIHEVKRETVGSSVLTGESKAQFTAGFLTTDIPGGAYLSVPRINECGLFCSDGVMFARRTYSSVAFGVGDRVGQLIRWIIEVL